MRFDAKLVLMVFVLGGMVFIQGCQKGDMKADEKAKLSPAETTQAIPQEAAPAEKESEPAAQAAAPAEEQKPAAEPTPSAPEAPKAPEAAPSITPETVDSNNIAVTVGGTIITEEEIELKMKPQLDRVAMQIDPNFLGEFKKRLRRQIVEGMITEHLLDEQVRKVGINITESDVNDRINEIISQQGMTIENLKALLTAQGQSFDKLQEQIKRGLGYEKLVENQIKEVDVNDAELLAYYNENIEDYNMPEQVRASHILIKVSATATEDEKATAKAKAEKLLKEIKGGADFATLASENSDDPSSKVKGGDLQFMGRGETVKPFEDVLFAMKPGQLSDVVETQYGYHIIKVTEIKPAGITPFDQVKPEIKKTLENAKKGQLFRQYIMKLKEQAKIEYPPGKELAPIAPMGQGEIEIE